MRLSGIDIIVALVLTLPQIMAQTLGESVVAANEDGAAWQTDTVRDGVGGGGGHADDAAWDIGTLGDSVVAGNDDGAAWVTESIADSTAASTTADWTHYDYVADHAGKADSSFTPSEEASEVGTVSPPNDSTAVNNASKTMDDGSTDDTTDEDTPRQSPAAESGSSEAPRILVAASTALIAVAIAAVLW